MHRSSRPSGAAWRRVGTKATGIVRKSVGQFATLSKRVFAPLQRTAQTVDDQIVDRFPVFGRRRVRIAMAIVSSIVLILSGLWLVQYFITSTPYDLGSARKLLAPISEPMASRIKHDSIANTFTFNEGYVASVPDIAQTPGPTIVATAHEDARKGVSVTDPANAITFTLKPAFDVKSGRQDGNRIVYPLSNHKGWLVYSMHSTSVKEDIVLIESPGNEISFGYTLELPEGTEARQESDGSIGVYGNDLLSQNVSAGSEADAQLLREARQNAEKNTLLFSIPAPVVIETGIRQSSLRSTFSLDGNDLTVTTTGLDNASYPLSIDPSIYVETAEKFMRGNNDSNIDFDVANTLIQKGETTGARYESFLTSTSLPSARWGHASAVAGGYSYIIGGNNGTTNQSSIYWAKFNTNDASIDSPNPGDGVCTDWCTDSLYDLPDPRTGLSVATYNGFLYAIGGEDASCTTTNGTGDSGICNTVYIAKLGANGEPSLWHPTDTNKTNWVYWYRAANLSSTRSYSAVVAYENRIFLLGGKTHTDLSGITTVESVDILPSGNLATWSTAGMPVLPSGAGRQHHSAEVYNDRVYVIGGVDGTVTTGNIVDTVFYARIVNGQLSSWTQASSMSGPRMTWGGDFTTIAGGYLYQAGGCSDVNAAGFCTTIESSTQFASLNMAGNITQWRTMSGVSSQYIGHALQSWNGAVYQIGGCSAQDSITGSCTTTSTATSYSTINAPGDITSVRTSNVSGTDTCSGATPIDCHLAPVGDNAGQGGQLMASTVVVRGHLYVFGGCVNVGCTDTSGNVAYTKLSPEGNLVRPSSCVNSFYGSWCVDTTNRINGTAGVAGSAVATYGNTVYVIGGTNGTTNTNTIYRNKINDDGSLQGAWTSQTFASIGATSVSHAFAYARANPSDSSNPANLYIFGGCTATSAASCTGSSYSSEVYKCNIQTTGALASCSTSGQLQIDSEPLTGGSQGLGLHAGAVFANYIYLAGGTSQTTSNKTSILYAKFDDSNNVVAQSGGSWLEASETLTAGRSKSVSFGYNGYLYVVGGFNSNVLSSIETAKINAIDGSIEQFETLGTTIGSRWGMTVGLSGSMAYILGGCSAGAGTGSCSSLDPSVHSILIHNNEGGAPEGYAASTNLFNTDRIAASATVLNGRLYIAGGCTDSASCLTITNDVQYATLDASGVVGSWSSVTADLPAARAWGQLEVAGGSLYFIGGQNNSAIATNDVYYATPTSSGDVTSWGTASNALPEARTQHSAAVWDNRIFVVGGLNSSNAAQNTVYVSPQLSSGGDIAGAWANATGFDVARSGLSAITYANNLYVIGGLSGTTHLSDVQFAKINSDGTLGDWTFTSNLPMPIQQADGFAANGYIYIFGGRSGPTIDDCQDRTYVAPISANTSTTNGNNPTGLGSWYEAAATYGGERYGIATAYHEGKAYLLGGGCAEYLNKTELFATPGNYTFTPPEETTTLIVEAWGGGGGGGSGQNGAGNAAGAGGGGSGYARGSITVTPGTYSLSVGAGGAATTSGTASWFGSTSTIFAAPGTGASWGPTIGTGGTANIGSDATFSGGNGGTGYATATPNNRRGGGGGGSAFYNANGNNGTNGTNQAGSGIGGTGTGTGGNGANNTGTGTAGGVPGAGGGGGGYRGTGGAGANGRVIVYFDEWTDLILTGNNRVMVANLSTQPQVARYSIMFDTDTDVFPSYWLLNGVDNSIGARWNLSYRSSTDTTTLCTSPAMTNWGQITQFGDVTLGLPGVYIPKNGAGTDTDCARFYYLAVEVDSSRAYGYPEDITRGPTITDLTLQFTADPSKRLLHGRTFTGGLQQPIDTPYYSN